MHSLLYFNIKVFSVHLLVEDSVLYSCNGLICVVFIKKCILTNIICILKIDGHDNVAILKQVPVFKTMWKQ